MTDEHDTPPTEADATPARTAWTTPVLTVIAAEEAAAAFTGTGDDYSLYS